MPRGRRPDPAGLQDAKGNPGKRRRTQLPPERDEKGGLRPAVKISVAAVRIWDQLAPELERMNFLRSTDRSAFTRYCDTLARYWDVRRQLDGKHLTYTSTSAHGDLQRINPLFAVEERLSKRLTDLEDRFGLSPASRQQIMLRLAQTSPQLPFGQPDPQPAAPPPPGGTAPTPASPIGGLSGASDRRLN